MLYSREGALESFPEAYPAEPSARPREETIKRTCALPNNSSRTARELTSSLWRTVSLLKDWTDKFAEHLVWDLRFDSSPSALGTIEPRCVWELRAEKDPLLVGDDDEQGAVLVIVGGFHDNLQRCLLDTPGTPILNPLLPRNFQGLVLVCIDADFCN